MEQTYPTHEPSFWQPTTKSADYAVTLANVELQDALKTVRKAALVEDVKFERLSVTASNEFGDMEDGTVLFAMKLSVGQPSHRKSMWVPIKIADGEAIGPQTFMDSTDREYPLTEEGVRQYLGMGFGEFRQLKHVPDVELSLTDRAVLPTLPARPFFSLASAGEGDAPTFDEHAEHSDERWVDHLDPTISGHQEDVIEVNTPTFIRLLELAREELDNDPDIHDLAEAAVSLSEQGVITMEDYDTLVSYMEDQGNDKPETTAIRRTAQVQPGDRVEWNPPYSNVGFGTDDPFAAEVPLGIGTVISVEGDMAEVQWENGEILPTQVQNLKRAAQRQRVSGFGMVLANGTDGHQDLMVGGEPCAPEDITGWALYEKTEPVAMVQMDKDFEVETLEGRMSADEGDYLAVGIEGEMWPLDKEIQEQTHEEVAILDGLEEYLED